ncbi:MAG: BadF/BadG/BcrA/BcrD ATPase family protein [Trueperaceae bacterium]
MIALGIDAGGSSTRWLLKDGECELARGRTASLSGPLYNEESRRETFARFEGIAAAALDSARPLAVLAGVTGLDEGTPGAKELQEVLARAFDLPPQSVRVVNDMQIAYRSVFEPERGVLVYAGTGSIACCELKDGTLLRTGGHGYLIDDAGGGFWIGSAALRAVLRAADNGDELAGPLAGEIRKALDAATWPEIRAAVYGGGRSKVASLAPAVGAAAAAGDRQALDILGQAGMELADLALPVVRRVGRQLPVAFAGGVARLGPALTDPFRAALPRGTELTVVDIEPVEVAARMAQELTR